MSPRHAKALDGRVGDDPAAALREHLIDAAEQLLAAAPIASITTRDIARKAGVSDGVLYNYFEDKTDLIVTALVRRYDMLATRFDAGLLQAGAGTVEENLNAFAGAWLALIGEALPTLAGLMAEPVLLHRLFEAIHLQPRGPQYLEARVTEYIAEEQRLGRLAADVDPASVAMLIMGSTVVLVASSAIAPLSEGVTLQSRLAPLMATLLRGLAPARS